MDLFDIKPLVAGLSFDTYTRYQEQAMPTIYREGPYRFFFNSREESRMHVHIQAPEGMAKFWLEPIVALAVAYQLNAKELSKIEQIVKEHQNEFIAAWRRHFSV